MAHIDAPYLIAFFRHAAQRLERERGMLCALDGEIGDGDHGTSMANGFAAVAKRLNALRNDPPSPEGVLREAASAFIEEVGATVGPLYATAFLEGATCLAAGPLTHAQVGTLMQAFADGIARRGKAGPGDKTMLDVWLPAAQAARRAAEDGMNARDVALLAADTAQQNARGTVSMIALRGRAARLNERSLGKLDPGAVSATLIIEVFVDLAEEAP